MITKDIRKSMIIRKSGRSSDFITPSFGFGCLLNCSYCYMKRHKPKGLSVAKNIEDILTKVNNHAYFTPIDKPNQTDDVYTTYDISCNEDFALHRKQYNWEYIFDFFKHHPVAKATLATKIIPWEFLRYKPNGKIRIRFSLMPQYLSDVLEPNTAKISKRIEAINTFISRGYDIHVNFSPVIVTGNWIDMYIELFKQLNKGVKDKYKEKVKAEVIFLTHNINKHEENLKKEKNRVFGSEFYLWNPDIQESKTSQYGGNNIRYKHILKKDYIKEFKYWHNKIIPWNTIRYIF